MKAARAHDKIILQFAPLEARLLRRIFSSIICQYQELKPAEVHPRVAEVWYSKRGCASARMTEEQTREWIENLHNLKMANLTLLRRWQEQVAPPLTGSAQLELTDDDSHSLMTVLNDHRLLCAARHNIEDEEMSIRSLADMEKLKPRQRTALVDIMFLAGIIETILALLPGNYGDWPAYAS